MLQSGGLGVTGGTMVKKWDSGDIGCGQFVFELHSRMKELQPGESIEVTTRDPGAPTDLPAWCRMTGNTLVSENHPVYIIRKKDD